MIPVLERLQAALADRYAIERELGAGGMATVYLAKDLRHHREVALKLLRPELGAILGAERFLQEIRLTANLQHPYILPLFDSGEADGLLFYVMPFVPGESLRQRLSREKQLPVDEAVRIGTQVAQALDYANRQGVVHRDIKPENILLADGQALVADFGIARAVRSAGGNRLTETGLSLGTPAYMSPEQATGERELDARSDVYSLGAVVYEMLAGEPPHTGPTSQSVIAKLMTEAPRALSLVRRTVPPQVEAAVHRALETLAADRFASAAEFAAALGATGAVTTSRVTGVRPAGLAAAGNARRKLATLTLGGLGLLAAGAVAGRFLFQAASPVAARPVYSAILPPPGDDFSERQSFGTLSPDGSRFAFVGRSARGQSRLWVRPLDVPDAQPLAGTDGAEMPFWSPDGRSVGFFARGELLIADLDGGSPRQLCPAPGPRGGAWSPRGVIIFITGQSIARVDVSGVGAGGACGELLRFPAGGEWSVARRPSFLADGHHFVLSVGLVAGAWVGRGDLGSTKVDSLFEGMDAMFVAPDRLVDGEFSSTGMTIRVWRVDPGSGRPLEAPTVIAEGVRSAGGIAGYAVSSGGLLYLPATRDLAKLEVNRRGEILDTIRINGSWTHAYAHVHPWLAAGGSGLVLYDLERRIPTTLPAPSGVWAAFAPKDSVIASGHCRLNLHRMSDGHDTIMVSRTSRCLTVSDWSADGRYLLATQMPGDSVINSEIWALVLPEGRPEKILAISGNVARGALSPDMRWLAYDSDESGTTEAYVRPFRQPGQAIRLSPDGGRSPRWRADGRELFYETPDGRIMAATVTPGLELKLGTPAMLFRAAGWDGRIFADPGTTFDVRPDGQQFVLRVAPTAAGQPAVLLQNWRALVAAKKRR